MSIYRAASRGITWPATIAIFVACDDYSASNVRGLVELRIQRAEESLTAASSKPSQVESDPSVPRHIDALDGVRGIAILLVLAFHYLPSRHHSGLIGLALNGVAGMGWSGVDLFFVLSGFLITGILLKSKEDPHYFRNFYARRTLRIFPLYYGMVFACTVLFPLLGIFKNAKPEGSSLWWWLYVSNFHFAFQPNVPEGWLQFFWSLAVEEHFYLIWPAIIYFCSRKSAVKVCVFCIILATVSRAIFVGLKIPWAPYLLTPCRMDSLAAGALIAIWSRDPGRTDRLVPFAKRIAIVSGIAAVVIILWQHAVLLRPVTQLIGFPLLTLTFSCLVLLAASPAGPPGLQRALGNRVLKIFGKYSYGLYVFQFAAGTLASFIRGFPFQIFSPTFQRANDWINAVVVTIITFAVAFASYHLYEKWFLKLKRFFAADRHQQINPTATVLPIPARD